MPVRRYPLPNPWLTATVLVWGFNFVAVKLLNLQMTAAAVSLVRFVPMYLLLIILCRLRGESLKYGKDSIPVLWQGFVSMGFYMVLFLEGMARTSAAEGAIILATAPVFVAIFSVIAKIERFTPGAIIGAAIAFIGTALVIASGAKGTHGSMEGNLMILSSAVVWAYGAVLSKPLVNKYSPLQSLTLSMPAALLILLPYGLMPTINVPWTSMTSQSWWMLFHVTFGAGVIGFLGFYEGVKAKGPAAAMLYQFFVPIVAAFFSYLLLRQGLNAWQAIGLGIVILGVYVAYRSRYLAASRLAVT
ncbi:MAG: DMT family transporter [Chlorobia bacterium]|nr:DMT family transporter [Fimbriimonadaceae bacterium]